MREQIRKGNFRTHTSGVCADYVQANLVIVPKEYAFDFLLFAMRNPKPCPIVDVLEAGMVESALAPQYDIRTDIPKYYLYEHGQLVKQLDHLLDVWRDDLVSFLIGCSFTFESQLLKENIPLRHVELNRNVAMYRTNIETKPAGPFSGPMVVSMRPIKKHLVQQAVEITARFPQMHGAPIHIGDPSEIGIADLSKPDYGEFVGIQADEVPVFWACGVTPQAVAIQAKIPLMITHAPGHMFVTDWSNDEYLQSRN